MRNVNLEFQLRGLSGGVLIVLSTALAWISVHHIWAPQEPLVGRALGFLAIVGLAVPLFVGGVWIGLTKTSLNGWNALRILGWCSAGMIPLVVFAVLFMFYQRQHGITLAEPFVMTLWMAGIGAVGGLLTGIYDVRQQKSHQRQRAITDRLSGIIEAAPVPIIELDPDGIVRRWNEAAEQVFGWTADEAIGNRLPFLSEEDHSEFATFRNQMMEGERLTNVEISRQTKDDELRDLLLSTTPIFDESGETLTSIIGVLVDITDQKQRRQRLKLFRSLLDHSNDSIFVVDADTGNLVDVNETACQRLNYDREELLKLSVMDVETTLSTEDEWLAHIDTIRQEGSLLYEGKQQRKDGSTFPVEVNIAHVELNQEYTVAIARDITDRKERERELQLKNRAMDEAPIGITITGPKDEDAPLLYANQGFQRLTGYSEEELLGRNCRFLQGDNTAPEPVAEMRQAIEAAEPATVVLRNYRKNGSEFWNRVTIAPVTDEDGDVTNFVGFQQDVTERKERERDLQRFEEAVDHAGHAVYITDPDGTITYVNDGFAKITGYSPEEAIGNDPSILQSGEHNDEYYQRLWNTILAGQVWEEEIINTRKSGERYTARQTIAPIQDNDEIIGFVAIQSDITDQRLREQRLHVLNRVLRHNLRTILNVIHGRIDLLLEDFTDTDRRQHAEIIKEQANRLEALSEKANTVEKALEDAHPPMRSTSVQEVLDRIVKFCQETYPQSDIEIEMPDTESVLVDASIQHVLKELVENAITHNDQSHPSVEITVTVKQSNNQVTIAVADDGSGIPTQERATLRKGIETPLQHGSGIGLWLVKWVTTALGGKVHIDDNDPRGSIVTVTVPIVSDSKNTENTDRIYTLSKPSRVHQASNQND